MLIWLWWLLHEGFWKGEWDATRKDWEYKGKKKKERAKNKEKESKT